MPAPSSPILQLACLAVFAVQVSALTAAQDDATFSKNIRPLLDEFCIKCHSTKEQKGELDLERFTTLAAVKGDVRVWQKVDEQLEIDEMPPAKKPQPSAAQKAQLVAWVRATLDEVALERAGDPGPVVVRRLSNSEYTYTLRDLTGVAGLDPAREFPVDGAAGEGFTNAGAALVMSPALFSKYLDAAKNVAKHAVLLPDGIDFSETTTSRDWTEEKLTAIRAFYAQFTTTGAGSSVNLQGIKFDTNHGGVIALDKYLAALIEEREALAGNAQSIAAVASARGLNAKYLGILWSALNDRKPSLLLDPIRAQWRGAKPADAPALLASIGKWQQALWQFGSVGQIGKRDSAKAWQEPVVPLGTSQEIRLKLPQPEAGKDILLHLVTSDAGDGAAGDAVIWEQARIVQKDRPPILLQDLQNLAERLGPTMQRELARTDAYLAALAESHQTKAPIEETAAKRKLDPKLTASWAALTELGSSGLPQVTGLYTNRIANQQWPAIRGWGSDSTPSLVVNVSDKTLQITTVTFPGRSVVTHPSPDKAATIHWRSPIDGTVRLEGTLIDVDNKCGNGIVWQLDRINRSGSSQVSGGTIESGGEQKIETDTEFAMRRGDLFRLAIHPRDRDHSCDSTKVVLKITELGGKKLVWNLADDIIDKIGDANPLGDSYGNAEVWHYGASGKDETATSPIPPGSAIDHWRQAVIDRKPAAEINRAAIAARTLLAAAAPAAGSSAADKELRKVLLDWNGPLAWLALSSKAKTPAGTPAPADIEASAPSVLTYRLPATLAAGAEFVAKGILHPQKGREGSVQMQAMLTHPGDSPTLGSTVVVAAASEKRKRIAADMDAFRDLFPAALCYTKIVPVDEVVTLTLYYREDWHLQRLMLDEAQIAQLDRLWDGLHFVSKSPLLLVDAFEQLYQYATQDADPSAFEPMREPIKLAAETFRTKMLAAEPQHLDALVEFAARAWRRPLSSAEQSGLRGFYRDLRNAELPHDDAIRQTLARVLVAPAFLYKLEDPQPGTSASQVSNSELATRLSYFLWSSTPDSELSAVKNLTAPDVIAAQARRMLSDARLRRLAIEFGSQWLHVRDFDQLDEKSERHFPEFAGIRGSLNEEPIRFFTDLFQRDGSVLELLDADHTFVDSQLAKYYGLPDSGAQGWRRVDSVRARGRGGVLGFGATLANQSGASRTSPILRGTWISETLLGERLPRPPKDVPILPDEAPRGLTERQLTARHSSDPSCARCHARIDPFGFALESYDAIGRLRSTDTAGLKIDAKARTIDGSEFEGIDGLRSYLLTKRRDDFVRQFCRKLLGFALGRSVLLSDAPLLDSIQEELAANDFRIGMAIEMIVRSRQFREIRGRDFPSG